MLYLLLAAAIVILPNALHVSVNTGIPGLNFTNLLLLLMVTVMALGRPDTNPSTGQPSRLRTPLLVFFGLLMIGFFVADPTPLSDTLTDVTRLKNAIFYPLLYFVYRRCRQDLTRTRQLILLVLLVAPLTAIEAIYQGVSFGLGEYVETQRATGPFGDTNMANRAGVFYAMFLPMVAAIAVFDKRKLVRIAAVVGCVLLASAILFTYSRQSYLIALVGLLILLMHRSVIAAVLASFLLVLTVSFFPQSVIDRVTQTQQVDKTGDATVDSSTMSRFEIWEGAANMWRDHPGGVGLGRFPTYIGKYASRDGVDAHNGFVLVWAELGPLGALMMFWLFWRMWGIGRALKRVAAPDDSETIALALGFKITVIAAALSNMYGSPFFEGLVMGSFWILCGLMERYTELKALSAAPVAAPAPSGPLAPLARMVDRFPLAARTLPGLGPASSATRS